MGERRRTEAERWLGWLASQLPDDEVLTWWRISSLAPAERVLRLRRALLIVVACVCTGWIGYAAAGAGFAVKLIPAVLGLLAPLERNWRGLLAFVASVGVLVAIPWAIVAFLPRRLFLYNPRS